MAGLNEGEAAWPHGTLLERLNEVAELAEQDAVTLPGWMHGLWRPGYAALCRQAVAALPAVATSAPVAEPVEPPAAS